MNELTSYQRRRLELADMIRAVLPVARAHGDEERERQIRELLTRLAAGRFKLAVIGQFSRGKTTLMNALLGAAYLPMGALPMTSVVTTVRYGTQARALVRSHATALPVQVPVAEVARFVARASAERTRMRVASVEVEIPAELLRLGFEFVDTPGVGSAIAANTAATLAYLPQADAVVFVTGFDSALTGAEADFLGTAADQAGKLFVVINKRDLVGDADAAEVTGYVRRWARGNLPAEPPVFGISALQALDGAVSNDPGQVAGSGIGPLRDALTRFLTAEQGRVALGNVADAAAGLVARQQRDLRAGQLIGGGTGPDAVAAGFRSRLAELRDQLAAVAGRITATADATVTSVLAERGGAWQAELIEALAPAATLPDDAVTGPGDDPVPAALDALRLAGRQAAGDWLERRTAELAETLTDAAADDIGVLLELARSPRELGASLAGLPVFDGAPAGWTAQEIPQLAVPVLDWAGPQATARRRRRRGHGSAEAASLVISAAISDGVSGFTGRAGPALLTAAAGWARRLGEQARGRADAEAAQFRRYLSASPREDHLAVLADVAGRLAGFRDSLAAWIPEASRPATGSEPEQAAAAIAVERQSCAICERQEAAQAEYLIRSQFLLATSEADQARHADTGGFCPLHTWLYAHLGSPVGISAGNAALASQLAGALREAGGASSHPSELAGHVARLVRAHACPACAVLARTEREAAEELAAQPPAAAGPRLCLRHLAVVLALRPPVAAGLAMTGALATALQRASEDMRAYALKREALRHGLVTADEASAYSRALRLIAGLPALALPAQPD